MVKDRDDINIYEFGTKKKLKFEMKLEPKMIAIICITIILIICIILLLALFCHNMYIKNKESKRSSPALVLILITFFCCWSVLKCHSR